MRIKVAFRIYNYAFIEKYTIGISATLLNKKIFQKYKFNPNYNIIGDFDFLKLSLSESFHPLQEPL